MAVDGGDDSQIDFSTAAATVPGATLFNNPYANHFVVRLNGVNRIDVQPALITLHGSVACGATTLSGVLNLTGGLANHIQFNGSDRITFNTTSSTLHGDFSATGALSSSNVLLSGVLKINDLDTMLSLIHI